MLKVNKNLKYRKCFVIGCRTSENNNPEKYEFFEISPNVKKEWCSALCRDPDTCDDEYICSKHFKASDLTMASQSNEVSLKPGALPSLFLDYVKVNKDMFVPIDFDKIKKVYVECSSTKKRLRVKIIRGIIDNTNSKRVGIVNVDKIDKSSLEKGVIYIYNVDEEPSKVEQNALNKKSKRIENKINQLITKNINPNKRKPVVRLEDISKKLTPTETGRYKAGDFEKINSDTDTVSEEHLVQLPKKRKHNNIVRKPRKRKEEGRRTGGTLLKDLNASSQFQFIPVNFPLNAIPGAAIQIEPTQTKERTTNQVHFVPVIPNPAFNNQLNNNLVMNPLAVNNQRDPLGSPIDLTEDADIATTINNNFRNALSQNPEMLTKLIKTVNHPNERNGQPIEATKSFENPLTKEKIDVVFHAKGNVLQDKNLADALSKTYEDGSDQYVLIKPGKLHSITPEKIQRCIDILTDKVVEENVEKETVKTCEKCEQSKNVPATKPADDHDYTLPKEIMEKIEKLEARGKRQRSFISQLRKKIALQYTKIDQLEKIIDSSNEILDVL